jgi:acyl-CoA reductase-like NAD-dependent aldehyde dehydrogenase
VVHKPSEVTPLNTLLLAEIATAAGVPDGVYNVVIGTGPNIGEHFDMVAFTGSTGAGRRVYELSAASVKKINLELGGKSASIVLSVADLATAVDAGVRQVFFASGQACFAWSRLFVPRDKLGEAEEIARATAETYRDRRSHGRVDNSRSARVACSATAGARLHRRRRRRRGQSGDRRSCPACRNRKGLLRFRHCAFERVTHNDRRP